MSCPEWSCPSCGALTFGFPEDTRDPKMPCSECGKILTTYHYSEVDEARYENSKKESYR